MCGQRDNLCAFWPCDNFTIEKISLGFIPGHYFCKVLSKFACASDLFFHCMPSNVLNILMFGRFSDITGTNFRFVLAIELIPL